MIKKSINDIYMKYIKIQLLAFMFCSLTGQLFSEKVLYSALGQPQQHKLIAMTIAGIVNRQEPRLYLLNVYETWNYTQTDEMWRDIYQNEGNFQFRTIININDLIDYFKADIKGAITYDASLLYSNFSGQSFMWQGEFAAMLGGFTDCIPVAYDNTFIQISRQDKTIVKDHFGQLPDLEISARLESNVHIWNNPTLSMERRYFTILNWGLDNILPRSNPTSFYLREVTDWAVSKRMFQLNLAGTESLRFTSLSDEKAAMLEKVMSYLKSKNPGKIFNVYGWMQPEPLTQWVSAWGGSFHETLLSNLSWHHAFPADSGFVYTRKSFVQDGNVPLENKHYVLFIGSEGDAGNWNFGFQSGGWLSKERGNVPLGWGFNLHFFEQFPFMAQYYYKSATANDGFISVTSPLGYAYHDMFPQDMIDDAKTKAATYLHKYQISSVYAYKHYNGAGVSSYRGISISNSFDFEKLGKFAKEINSKLTFLFDPKLQTQKLYQDYGGLLYNHVNDNTFYFNMTNLSSVSAGIIQKLKEKTGPSFLLAGYQRIRSDETPINSNNQSDLTLSRLKTIMETIKSDPDIGSKVEFVTPEKFTALIRQTIPVSSIHDQQPQTNKPLIYSNHQESIKVIFQNGDHTFKTLFLFDLQGRQVAHVSTCNNENDIYLTAKNEKYVLVIVKEENVKSYFIVH
jgi:hypothetical protein